MVMQETQFMTIEQFRKYVNDEIIDSFINNCKTYKEQYNYILEYYNITYDKLCGMILTNAKDILESENFTNLYNTDISRLNDFIYAFGELLDEKYLETCVEEVYTQRYNYVLYKSGIITEANLGMELK